MKTQPLANPEYFEEMAAAEWDDVPTRQQAFGALPSDPPVFE